MLSRKFIKFITCQAGGGRGNLGLKSLLVMRLMIPHMQNQINPFSMPCCFGKFGTLILFHSDKQLWESQ